MCVCIIYKGEYKHIYTYKYTYIYIYVQYVLITVINYKHVEASPQKALLSEPTLT